jgi:ribosome-associated toxin RatA of RatAB toxin-antitoxin module
MTRPTHRFDMGAAGRIGASRLVVVAALVCGAALLEASDAPTAGATVDVTERAGVYRVAASFSVDQPRQLALATLTDYEAIPRFMPEVRTSRVVERRGDRMIVEQEAVARFMLFSKRVHLVLDVQQEPARIRFSDRCGESFSRYDGTWTLTERAATTQITYELEAQPSFDVPAFLLRRLLKRDASQMIERLRTEMASRARVDAHRSQPDAGGSALATPDWRQWPAHAH